MIRDLRGMLGAVPAVRGLLVMIALAVVPRPSAADDAPPPATLVFDPGVATRVVVDGQRQRRWADPEQSRLHVARRGFRKVVVTFVTHKGTYRAARYIGLAPGVEVKLWDHNGARIRAEPAGKRCARVDGATRRQWRLCDGGDEQTIPVGKVFDLECPNPADLGRDHRFWLAPKQLGGDSIVSPVFVPTLPGLYRARLRGGRIVVTYSPSDCAGSKPLPGGA